MTILWYLSCVDAMDRVSAGFSKRLSSVLIGAIGALDGWLVHLVAPSWWRDSIKNKIKFFSCKVFYALSFQCIVDHEKRALWASYYHKGVSHDSSCFWNTQIYEKLNEMQELLYPLGYFILGDSSYAIKYVCFLPITNQTLEVLKIISTSSVPVLV